MAAKTVTQLPVGPGWSFEPKYDGFRALAFAGQGGVVLQSRQLRDLTPAFPDVAAAVRHLGEVVVDGELVVWRAGRFDFAALQDRLRSGRVRVRGLVAAEPAACVAVEDSANGLRAAAAAAMVVVAVPNPHFPPPADVLALARATVPTPAGVTPELIRAL